MINEIRLSLNFQDKIRLTKVFGLKLSSVPSYL